MNDLVSAFLVSGLVAGSIFGTILLVFASAFFAIGLPLAVVISWQRYNSIFWTTILGMLGWIYVLYYYFVLQNK